MLTNEDISNYLAKLDIRLELINGKKNILRHTDHKVQADVVEVLAEIILEFSKKQEIFSAPDIRDDPESYQIVNRTFAKKKWPDKEMDKFFLQLCHFFGFYKILELQKKGNRNYFKVLRKDILKYLENHPRNTAYFIGQAHVNFLNQNADLKIHYDDFFHKQNDDSYKKMKIEHGKFLEKYTGVKDKKHKDRIFIPFTNNLAYSLNKKGTERGYCSKNRIGWDEIMYNRPNWFDKRTKKDEKYTRTQWKKIYLEQLKLKDEQKALDAIEATAVRKVKKKHKGLSEYSGKKSRDIHHIFPRTPFDNLRYLKENLINLTPDEHFMKAHPDGTNNVDKEFQTELLLKKLKSISTLLKEKDDFYRLDYFIEVLNTGYDVKIPKTSSVKDLENFLNSRKH